MSNDAEVFARPNAGIVTRVVENVLQSENCPKEDNYSFPAVYCLKHSSSEKVYVGSTKNLSKRIKDHRVRLQGNRHPNANIQNAFNDDSEFHLVYAPCESKETATESEQILLDQFNRISKETLLNIAKDAVVPMQGLKMSDETRKKMSLSHKAQSSDEEFRSAIKKRMKNLWETEEGRNKYMSCVGQKPDPVVVNGVEYNDPKEAAKIFNCHRITIQRWAKKQKEGSEKVLPIKTLR